MVDREWWFALAVENRMWFFKPRVYPATIIIHGSSEVIPWDTSSVQVGGRAREHVV